MYVRLFKKNIEGTCAHSCLRAQLAVRRAVWHISSCWPWGVTAEYYSEV